MTKTKPPALKPLTERQAEIFGAIVRHFRDHQRMPSLREIGAAVGIGSPNGVFGHLQFMEKKGWIVLDRTLARGIRVPLLERAVKAAVDEVLAGIDTGGV